MRLDPMLPVLLASAGAVGLSLAAIGKASAGETLTADRDDSDAEAIVRNAAGADIGVVRFRQNDGAVVVNAKIRGLSEGFHGFHVHANGLCDPPFTSAGGHYDPAGRIHGSHAGDMPTLVANPDGTAEAHFKTNRFSIAELVGRAIIVHRDPDNLAHIPGRYHSHTTGELGPDSATRATGDAGDRIACGVIQPSN
jgi:Cu-Zn family superoxide dismutase